MNSNRNFLNMVSEHSTVPCTRAVTTSGTLCPTWGFIFKRDSDHLENAQEMHQEGKWPRNLPR